MLACFFDYVSRNTQVIYKKSSLSFIFLQAFNLLGMTKETLVW